MTMGILWDEALHIAPHSRRYKEVLALLDAAIEGTHGPT